MGEQIVARLGVNEFDHDVLHLAFPRAGHGIAAPPGEPVTHIPPSETSTGMELVWPSSKYLPGYVDALERGWSPNTLRPEAGLEELERIAVDADSFLAGLIDLEGKGPPVQLPDGSTAARLPGYRRWMWDGQYCGSISFRWQPGTTALPPHCLGHIGYSVVPWKRGRGYATRALALLLEDVREEGLEFVELTTEVTNLASQRVIEANGGILVERFDLPPMYGSGEDFRFRIFFRGS